MNRIRTAVILFVTALLAGCSAESSGTPAPSSATSVSPLLSTEDSAYGAPTIETPLKIDSFLEQPCTSLKRDQIIGYLGDETKTESHRDNAAGPSCLWRSDIRSDAHIIIMYPRVTDKGLSAIYRNREEHAFFVEMPPIDGYPTVAVSTIDNRSEGECPVLVGTSNSDYVSVYLHLGKSSVGKIDPCEAAHEVATTVIGNIKASNSE